MVITISSHIFLNGIAYPIALTDKTGVVFLSDGDCAGAALLVYDCRRN